LCSHAAHAGPTATLLHSRLKMAQKWQMGRSNYG